MLRYLIMMFGPMFLSWDLLAAECKIDAEAVVGFLEFSIEGCDIKGDLIEKNGTFSGNFSVDLTKLDTGLSLRNRHMRDKYLKTKDNPTATLKLVPVKYGAKTFDADLRLNGKTRPIKGTVLSAEKGALHVKFKVDITDYGIDKPGYKGVVIGEKINVLVRIP